MHSKTSYCNTGVHKLKCNSGNLYDGKTNVNY